MLNQHKKGLTTFLKLALKKKFFKLLKTSWPVFLIAFVVLAFFYPVWLRGLVPLPADIVVGSYYPWLDYKWGYPVGVPVKNPITSDAISFSFPMRMLAIDFLKNGQWPLWNPYILFGTPLLANFQSAPFSPTNFVYFIFDKLTAWSIQVILQHFLAAFFTFLLLRSWKVSNIGAVAGGVIFAFSGFNLIWSQWNAHALTAAFIPLVIFFVEKLGRTGSWWAGFGLSTSLAFQLFSGYPQLVFYSLAALAIFWLVVVWGTKKFLSRTASLVVYLLLGIGMASVQLLPGYELLLLSQRATEAIPLEWVFLSWEQVITFLAPDFFGNHATGNYWGPKNYTSVVGFVGVASLILTGFALSLWKIKKEVRVFILVAILALILAFPTPISVFLLQANPLGLQAGVSLRSLVLFNLAIAGLAAFGFDRLLKMRQKASLLPFVTPCLILVGFLFYVVVALVLKLEDDTNLGVALRNLVLPFLSLLVVLLFIFFFKHKFVPRWLLIGGMYAIILLELFYFGWKFTPFSPKSIVYPQTPVLDFLSNQEQPFRFHGGNVVPANLLIPYKLESVSGYDAVYPARIAKFISVLNSNDLDSTPQDRYGIVNNLSSRLLNLVNAKFVLFKSDAFADAQGAGRFTEIFRDKSVVVAENKDALPRSFKVHNVEVVSDDRQALSRLLNPEFPIDKKIVLSQEVAPSDMLFVSETFYPGWKAFVDGHETPIYRANFAFRAIELPQGEHEVVFVYQPTPFFNGLKLSAISLILLLVFIMVFRVLGKRLKYGYT